MRPSPTVKDGAGQPLIGVLLADDDRLHRAEVRAVLEYDRRFEVCAEVADAAAAVAAALRVSPDICLLDVTLPGNGISAAWEIAARLPDTRVVMLTASDDDIALFGAVRAGAVGYLLKGMDLCRLPHALHDVSLGTAAITRAMVTRMVEQFQDSDARRRAIVAADGHGRLTSREWQILEFLAAGCGTADIARRLTLSQSAVRVHIAAVVRKLGVVDRHEAAAHFRRRASA